jgi:hypothetical protein
MRTLDQQAERKVFRCLANQRFTRPNATWFEGGRRNYLSAQWLGHLRHRDRNLTVAYTAKQRDADQDDY